MRPSTEDKTTGKIYEARGAIRKKVGELASNPDLEADGKAEKIAGKVQNVVGKIEKATGEQIHQHGICNRERLRDNDAITIRTGK